MKDKKARVYFAFDGNNFDPDAVTEFLGVDPTLTKYKGEIVSGRIIKNSSWQLSTNNIIDEYIDIFEMTRNIVNQLKPKKRAY